MIQNRYSRQPSAVDWTGQVTEIKEAKKERDRLYSIMTQYERQTVAEYIGETAEKYRPTIEGGALEVWEGAKTNLKAAINNVEAQKRKVSNSWDAGKLDSEMAVLTRRMEIAAKNGDVEALQNIYAEAKNSGDRIKAKAAGEVFQGVVNLIQRGMQDKNGTDARQVANRLVQEARRDLASLETTPELAAAHEQAASRVAELNAAKKILYDAAETLGELNPNNTLRNTAFIHALETVQQDTGGNFIFTDKE